MKGIFSGVIGGLAALIGLTVIFGSWYTVIKANASADAVRASAKAEADAIKLKGEAEASAIQVKGAALRDNPSLVSLVTAERWNGTLPATMVPNSAVPFVSLAPTH